MQRELEEFRIWWNQHRVRFQPEKDMPSGHVPADALVHPELLGGLDCLISVPAPVISELFLQWVSPEFAGLAEHVYELLGKPEITFTNAWDIFHAMSECSESD